MASLGNILRGALGGEYSMGRDLDDEERRQIEELRAAGVYVPQESQSSPFRYGAGSVRKQNLQDMRDAMQLSQKSKMEEYVNAQKRDAAMKAAIQNQQRLAELTSQQGSTFDAQGGQSYKDYLRNRLANPSLSPEEQAELTVRQQQQLPIREAEADATLAEQRVAAGALRLPTQEVEERDKRETLELAGKVRSLMSPDFARLTAENTELGAKLQNKLLESKIAVENSPAGRSIRQQTANNQEAQARIDGLILDQFSAWLNSGSADAQAFKNMGGQPGLDIADQINTMKARLMAASSRSLTGGLRDALPDGFPANQPQSRGALSAYSADEETANQPARPPITRQNLARPPMQPSAIPRRPMREAQTMAAPALSPAPRSPMPEFPMGTQFLREAGSTGRTNAAYVKRAELIGELERARAVVERRQAAGERPFQIDLETVAAIEAELTSLMAENPELQN